jgi:hypothetical protein
MDDPRRAEGRARVPRRRLERIVGRRHQSRGRSR